MEKYGLLSLNYRCYYFLLWALVPQICKSFMWNLVTVAWKFALWHMFYHMTSLLFSGKRRVIKVVWPQLFGATHNVTDNVCVNNAFFYWNNVLLFLGDKILFKRSYTRGNLTWHLWNSPKARFIHFIWNDDSCSIPYVHHILFSEDSAFNLITLIEKKTPLLSWRNCEWWNLKSGRSPRSSVV